MGVAAGGIGVGGIDPAPLLEMTQQAGGGSSAQEVQRGAPSDETGQFVSKVLGSTEDVWSGIFQRSNAVYRAPTLVLYEGQVRSACGMGQAAIYRRVSARRAISRRPM